MRWFIPFIPLFACVDQPPPQPDLRFAPLTAAIQQDLAHQTATAASVAVWLDDQVVWVGGFGAADAVGGPPPDEATQFDIGSDTKKITAIALLREVQAGKATLDSRVFDVLPDLHMMIGVPFATATIRQLLSHQGGIVDDLELTTSTTDAALASYAYGTFADTYASMVPPGTVWNYSNPNFAIAGLMDRQLDGRPWADLVEGDLFGPLAMTARSHAGARSTTTTRSATATPSASKMTRSIRSRSPTTGSPRSRDRRVSCGRHPAIRCATRASSSTAILACSIPPCCTRSRRHRSRCIPTSPTATASA